MGNVAVRPGEFFAFQKVGLDFSVDPWGAITQDLKIGPEDGGRPDSLEAVMDVQWAHVAAPGARILLVVANSNETEDLLKAAKWAAGSGPTDQWGSQWGVSVVSMSFGTSPGNFTQAQLDEFDGHSQPVRPLRKAA